MIGASGQSQEQQSNRSLSSPQQQQSQKQQPQHQHLVNHRVSGANQKHNVDDPYEEDNGVRVGTNYQAEIPQFIAYAPAPEYYEEEKAIRVWSPYNKIPDHVLEEFILKAKEKFTYNTEQALGMLCWHKFDLNRAIADLPNFVPYPNEWSVEDKVLFEQAYQFHEKQFNKIRQMLPDKSMANLINYYYSWKKTRSRPSLMERQTRRLAARKAVDSNGPSDEEENDNDGVAVANNAETNNDNDGDSDLDRKGVSNEDQENSDADIDCSRCEKKLRHQGRTLCIIYEDDTEPFCADCFFKILTKPGIKIEANPESGDCFYHTDGERKRILFTYFDVLQLVKADRSDAGDIIIKQLDAQISNIKRDIQLKKQTLSQINEKIQPITDQIADLDMDQFSNILPEYKPTREWSQEETQMVIQSLRRYGTDFSAISDIIRTKSPEVIEQFFILQKDRLGLQYLVDQSQDH